MLLLQIFKRVIECVKVCVREIACACGTDRAACRDGISTTVGEESEELGFFAKAKILAQAFKPAYWQALFVVGLLYFGRFDFTFVTLRAKVVRPSNFTISIGRCFFIYTKLG